MEKEIVKKVCEYAQIYDKNLKGKNIMFIFENMVNKEIDYIETEFLANNYKHLTGIECKEKIEPIKFYKLCINSKLSYKVIKQKDNGTTKLKLEVLPQLLNIAKNAKLVANYNGSKINLYTEKVIGNVRCCIGFVKNDKYYLPNTILKQDIREISQFESNCRIIAILEKMSKQKQYDKVTYMNEKIDLKEIVSKLKIEEKIINIFYEKPLTKLKKWCKVY